MARIVAGLVSIALLIAACGNGDAEDSDGSSGLTDDDAALVEELEDVLSDDPDVSTEVLEQAAERSADAATAAVAVDVSPCDLLTVEEIESVIGFAVESVTDEPPMDCRFDLVADSDLYVLTTVDDAQGRLGGPAATFQRYLDEGAASPYEVVDGVGEAALYVSRFLTVDAGEGRYVAVGVGGQYLELAEPRELVIELAEIALTRI